METISVVKEKKNNIGQNSVVQVTGNNIGNMYKGYIGFILEYGDKESIVGFYAPKDKDMTPFVQKIRFNNDDLTLVGEPSIKPKL